MEDNALGEKMADHECPRSDLADNAPGAKWQLMRQEGNGRSGFGGGLVGSDSDNERERDSGRYCPSSEMADNAPGATSQLMLQEGNGRSGFGGRLVGGDNDSKRERERVRKRETASGSTLYERLRLPPTVSVS